MSKKWVVRDRYTGEQSEGMKDKGKAQKLRDTLNLLNPWPSEFTDPRLLNTVGVWCPLSSRYKFLGYGAKRYVVSKRRRSKRNASS